MDAPPNAERDPGDRLQIVSDATWREFSTAPVAVLVITESGCPVCSSWSRSLRDHLRGTPAWDRVRFGKIEVDLPTAEAFRRENAEWLELVAGVPFNVIYVNGEPRASFAGAGVDRLEDRLRRHALDVRAAGPARCSGSTAGSPR